MWESPKEPIDCGSGSTFAGPSRMRVGRYAEKLLNQSLEYKRAGHLGDGSGAAAAPQD